MTHISDAIVVCCMDFRLQKFIRQWTDEHLPGKTFDLVGFAGSTKSLEIIQGQIDISVRLHHTKEVHLIHHEECGAYGVESTHERHVQDLHIASEAIKAKFPEVEVKMYYMYLDGRVENID